jgi:hypothetical protein
MKSSIIGIMLWRLIVAASPYRNPDFTYTLYVLALQSELEVWLGIIAANVPTLGPLVSGIIYPKMKGYFESRGPDNSTPRGGIVRTFGSGPKKFRRDEFGLLSEDVSIELAEITPSKNAIRRDRDFHVTVEDGLGPAGKSRVM